MTDLKQTLIEEKKKIMQKDILSKEDMNILDKIDAKLLDMDDINIDDNTIKWSKENITVLYYIGKKVSQDMLEVLVDNNVMIPKVKWNLRDNYAQQQKLLKKLQSFNNSIVETDVVEITKSITHSVVNVVSDVIYSKEKIKNISYEMIDSLISVDLIHPALDFTDNEMYVGVDAMSQDTEGVIEMRHFILTNSSEVIPVPELPDHNIQLTRTPMVMKKKFFSLPTSEVTPHTTLTTQYSIIRDKFDYYIDFIDKRASIFLSLWTIGTYIHKLFNAFPYVTLFGYKGTGKTKIMDVSALMSFNGQKSVGISPSALFRGTDGMAWTLFFDESGLLKNISNEGKSKRADEIAPIILSGYKRGGVVPRTGSKESGFALECFNTYCPKMFASTYEMDEILESRAIQIVMRPADKGEGKGNREPDEFSEEWLKIRTDTLLACLKEWREIKDIYSILDNETKLDNRDWEICKPICAIGKHILDEDEYKELTEYLENNLVKKKDEFSDKTDFEIIRALVRMDMWDQRLTTDMILSDIQQNYRSGMRPDWMNSRWLGRRLKKMGIPMETGREGRGKWYLFKQEDIYETVMRFGIDITEEKPKKIPSDDLNMNQQLGAW